MMTAHRLPEEFWPVDVAHATEDAEAAWHCSRGRGKARRNFYIFRQREDGRYLVRERGSWGWSIVGEDDFRTLGAAKRAAETED